MTTPSDEYVRTQFRRPSALHQGLDRFVHRLAGMYRRRSSILAALESDAREVDSLEDEFRTLSDQALQERLCGFRSRFKRGGRVTDSVLIPALAAVREAAHRQVGLRPFHVQITAALALYRGYLIEMATGEGKTLTAGLAGVLFGWSGKPCHVITVNDYLVQRDAEWLRPLYRFAGVVNGSVIGQMQPNERREGYACDVTYTTSKELVADFLRDALKVRGLRDPARRLIYRLATHSTGLDDVLVMRGLHTALVDEADSILIDEAVTPLIISSPRKNEALQDVVRLANQIVEPFERETDYRVSSRYRDVELTQRGEEKLRERCATLPGIWQGHDRRLEIVKQAIEAREFFQLDKQYVIAEGRVVIVDEFTGRPMPQRSWRQGLHQAIEAKEGLSLTDPTETLARLSFQRFFRLFHRLSGMTGTAREASAELWQIYSLPVIAIPPNRPCVRKDLPDRLFADERAKSQAVVDDIVRVHASGRPILIGTRSVAASERLADRLAEKGLAFRVLNAVRHEEEAQIIVEAGARGRITIATNMAGRGTDIKLGAGVAELGGLHVIATERHESRRVDRQLFGRSGRQGDPGSAQAFVSCDDDLLRRFVPARTREGLAQALKSNLPLASKWAARAVASAQHTAQIAAFRQRCQVLKTDDWLEESLSFAGSDLG